MATPIVVLNESSDWRSWIYTVKMAAMDHDLWDYINPDNTTPPVPPVTPTRPTYSSINEHATTIADFSVSDLEKWKQAMEIYTILKADNQHYRNGIIHVRERIRASVPQKNVVFIEGVYEIRDILKKLKARFELSECVRRQEVFNRLKAVKTYNMHQDAMEWLDEWTRVYDEAEKLQLLEANNGLAIQAFYQAVAPLNPIFSSNKLIAFDILLQEQSPQVPTLADEINLFRNEFRLAAMGQSDVSQKPAPTLNAEYPSQGRKGGPNSSKAKLKNGNLTCKCGGKHHFRDCLYINPSSRPSTWVPLEDIFNKINNKILKDKKHTNGRQWFETMYGYDGFNRGPGSESNTESSTNSNASSSITNPSSYSGRDGQFAFRITENYTLHYDWVICNATDVHICNSDSTHRYKKTRDALPGDVLFSGGEICKIESWGTVDVPVVSPTGTHEVLELKNVAFVPGFMTSLVALSQLAKNRVHWSSRQPELLTYDSNNLPWLQLGQKGNLWVIVPRTIDTSD